MARLFRGLTEAEMVRETAYSNAVECILAEAQMRRFEKSRDIGGEDTRFDYDQQAWVVNGRYISCGHVSPCNCYGRIHAGELADWRNIFLLEEPTRDEFGDIILN